MNKILSFALTLVVLFSSASWAGAQPEVVPLTSADYMARDIPLDAIDIIGISSSGHHAIAVKRDGRLTAWGANWFGETNIPWTINNAIAVAAGETFSVVLCADGIVTNFGYFQSAKPVHPPYLFNVTAIAARADHVLTLRDDGTVSAYGGNSAGQSETPPDNRGFMAISAGTFHNLALKTNGTVIAWGQNKYGELNVPAELTNATAIAAGFDHSVALRSDGTVIAWGNNDRGQTAVPAGLGGVVAIAAGDWRTLAMRADGTLVAWGLTNDIPAGLHASGISPDGRFAVTTLRAPRFTVEPLNQSVSVYQPVTFISEAVGAPPIRYHWRFNDQDILSATQATLTIPSVQKGDFGGYTVLAKNAYGFVISRRATLVNNEVGNLPPFFRLQPNCSSYGTAQITVTNTAKDADMVPNNLAYELVASPAGATIDHLGIIRWTPRPQDVPSENVFTTVVRDDGFPPLSATNTFKVFVDELAEPGRVTIIAGPIINPKNQHRYYLTDRASWTDAEAAAVELGGHLVTVNDYEEHQWVRDTFSKYGDTPRELWIGLIDPDPSITATPSHSAWENHFVWASGQPITFFCWFTGPTTSQGVGRIKMTKPGPSGLYANPEWTPEAEWVPLHSVIEVPLDLQFITQPKSVSVGIGRTATFSVVADSLAPISYQWQFMGTNLPGETNPSLTLTNAQPDQTGPYRVIISNAYGSVASTTVNLDVAGIVGWGGMALYGAFDVPANAMNVVGIAAGPYHALALRNDGTVVAWGRNHTGQLNVPSDLHDAIAVAAGTTFSLALKADGTVVSWGTNAQGNVVNTENMTNVTAIAAGGGRALALKADGTVVSNADESTIPAGLKDVVAIAAESGHALALKSDGTLVAWGTYAWTSETGHIPAFVPEGLKDVIAITTGTAHAMALKADGTVVAWGFDLTGGATKVPPTLRDVVAIAAGNWHSLALTKDGTVVQWGMIGAAVPKPQDLPNIVAITAGGEHSFALLKDGAPRLTVQPWGVTVPTGGSPKFKAKAIGKGSVDYQWNFNGKPIPGATQDTYAIAEAQPEDAGVYTVTVTNTFGEAVSRPAELKIADGPAPDVLNVSAGQPLVFTNTPAISNSGANFTFELLSPLDGATLDATTGIFSFRPPVRMAGSTNILEIRVTDDASPPVVSTQHLTVVVAPLSPVFLAPASLEAGDFKLRVDGPLGPDYILQASPDLIEWNDVQTNAPGTIPFEFTDTLSTTNRFYRIQLGP